MQRIWYTSKISNNKTCIQQTLCKNIGKGKKLFNQIHQACIVNITKLIQIFTNLTVFSSFLW